MFPTGQTRLLQLELFLNLLEIIRHHPRQPEILSQYMQPHLLRTRRKRKTPDETPAAD